MRRELSPLDVMALKRSVAIIWDAVQRGVYDSRSIAGDECLSMKEILFGDRYEELNAEIEKIKASQFRSYSDGSTGE